MLYNKSSKHSLRAEINPIALLPPSGGEEGILDKIAESMNSKRKDFVMPSDHRIVITNNLLFPPPPPGEEGGEGVIKV